MSCFGMDSLEDVCVRNDKCGFYQKSKKTSLQMSKVHFGAKALFFSEAKLIPSIFRQKIARMDALERGIFCEASPPRCGINGRIYDC